MTDGPHRVAVVVVSHSAGLADGVVELAGQMAPDVQILSAGGGDDGGLGTSFDRISAALQTALTSPAGVVVLYDLGSALLSTETALEFLDPDQSQRVDIVAAPLVEGAIAAATTAQGGAPRAQVAAAARSAAGLPADDAPDDAANDAAPTSAVTAAEDPDARTVSLRNPLGLHARPAAEVVRALTGLDALVWLSRPGGSRVDARSLLAVVNLAMRGGEDVVVAATGSDAAEARQRIVGLVEAGFGELPSNGADLTPTPAQPSPRSGTPAPGVVGRAVGPLVRARVPEVADRPGAGADIERDRLQRAVSAVVDRLDRGDALQRAHAALVADPGLQQAADSGLQTGSAAEPAWWRAITSAAAELAAAPDELLQARAVDVRDAGSAVLAQLGAPVDRIPTESDGAVLAADELGPSEISTFAERGGAGVVLSGGSPTAHAVVVARGLGVPLVLRAGELLDTVAEGTIVAIDGGAGTVDVDPADVTARRAQVEADRTRAEAERKVAAAPIVVDGRPIVIAANVGSLTDARAAMDAGADGVGLLRTELLVLDRPELPDEDRQVGDLAEILQVLGDRPVVIRVLDPGGDKPVQALALDERRNGFLGVRGLRWLLANPNVLRTQLRAICRASVGHRVSVMAPMVTVAAEARAFREAVHDAVQALVADGTPHQAPDRVGVMVEVPAAALAADEVGAEVDFVSVGSNDLVAYTMAADRTEPGVAELLDPSATAVWRLLEQLCRTVGVDVAVCGEMAGDDRFARRLVDLGVHELSMAPARVPVIKAMLRDPPRGGARGPRS